MVKVDHVIIPHALCTSIIGDPGIVFVTLSIYPTTVYCLRQNAGRTLQSTLIDQQASIIDHTRLFVHIHTDGLVQDCSIASALAMEIQQFCRGPKVLVQCLESHDLSSWPFRTVMTVYTAYVEAESVRSICSCDEWHLSGSLITALPL